MKRYIIYVLIYILGTTQVIADTISPVKVKDDIPSLQGLEKRVTLDLRGIDILDLLKFLAMEGNLNIAVDKDVGGKISVFLKDIRIRDVLDIAIASNNLAYVIKDGVIKVMTGSRYELTYGIMYHDERETRILRLKYAKPESVISLLEKVKSKVGSIVIDQATGAVILIDTPQKLKEMERVIENVDIPLETRTFMLRYADTESIVDHLNKLLTPNVGLITVDKKTRTLVIRDFPQNVKRIKRIITTLDRRMRQVLIEAKIVKVELSDNFEMGINW